MQRFRSEQKKIVNKIFYHKKSEHSIKRTAFAKTIKVSGIKKQILHSTGILAISVFTGYSDFI